MRFLSCLGRLTAVNNIQSLHTKVSQ
jgi:hypothetical protein